jgi:hypothetical protein
MLVEESEGDSLQGLLVKLETRESSGEVPILDAEEDNDVNDNIGDDFRRGGVDKGVTGDSLLVKESEGDALQGLLEELDKLDTLS